MTVKDSEFIWYAKLYIYAHAHARAFMVRVNSGLVRVNYNEYNSLYVFLNISGGELRGSMGKFPK